MFSKEWVKILFKQSTGLKTETVGRVERCRAVKRAGPLLVQYVMRRGTGTSAPSALPRFLYLFQATSGAFLKDFLCFWPTNENNFVCLNIA